MQSLLLPMSAHLLWVLLLYVFLTIARAPQVWGVRSRSFNLERLVALEGRISANLSNQFEWPMFFHIACVLGVIGDLAAHSAFLLLAWIFVAGRVLHSLVQIFSTNIRLRGIVFTVNFIAVLLMWAVVFAQEVPAVGL